MLTTTQGGLEFINGSQMTGKVRELLVNISPFRHIQVFNINRNINDAMQFYINRVKSNINAINITDKFKGSCISEPFTFFCKSSLNKGKRVLARIKNHKSEINNQGEDIERENNPFIDRFNFQALNQGNRNNYNPEKVYISKESLKARVFVVNKIIKQISQPPFKNVSNQGGDDSCSEGYNELCDEIPNIHNATSKGFCQSSSSSPSHYSPAGVAKKTKEVREDAIHLLLKEKNRGSKEGRK